MRNFISGWLFLAVGGSVINPQAFEPFLRGIFTDAFFVVRAAALATLIGWVLFMRVRINQSQALLSVLLLFLLFYASLIGVAQGHDSLTLHPLRLFLLIILPAIFMGLLIYSDPRLVFFLILSMGVTGIGLSVELFSVPSAWGLDVRRANLDRLLGGTIYLGRYTAAGFLALALVSLAQMEKGRLKRMMLFGVSGVFCLAGSFFSGTRGPLVSLLLVFPVGLLLLGYIFGWKIKWLFAVMSALVTAAILILAKWADFSETVALRTVRFLNFKRLSEDPNVEARLQLLDGTLDRARFFGVPPDERMYTHPHNILAEALLNYGIIGLILVGSILLLPVVSLFSALRRKKYLMALIARKRMASELQSNMVIIFVIYLFFLFNSFISNDLLGNRNLFILAGACIAACDGYKRSMQQITVDRTLSETCEGARGARQSLS